MSTLYTYKHIQTATGLQVDFIRKVHKANLELFKPYTGPRGDGNCVQFFSSVVPLFQVVQQLKEENATVAAISEKLQEIIAQGGMQTTEQSQQEPTKPRAVEMSPEWVVEQLKEAHKETIETLKSQLKDKDGIIAEKERLITEKDAHFQAQILQLKDPRSQEQIEKDKADEEKRKQDLEDQAEAERERVQESLRKAEQERDEARERADSLTKVLKEHRERLATIRQRLEELDGKWLAGKERKKLYAQQREAEAEIEKLLGNQAGGDLELEAKPE